MLVITKIKRRTVENHCDQFQPFQTTTWFVTRCYLLSSKKPNILKRNSRAYHPRDNLLRHSTVPQPYRGETPFQALGKNALHPMQKTSDQNFLGVLWFPIRRWGKNLATDLEPRAPRWFRKQEWLYPKQRDKVIMEKMFQLVFAFQQINCFLKFVIVCAASSSTVLQACKVRLSLDSFWSDSNLNFQFLLLLSALLYVFDQLTDLFFPSMLLFEFWNFSRKKITHIVSIKPVSIYCEIFTAKLVQYVLLDWVDEIFRKCLESIRKRFEFMVLK